MLFLLQIENIEGIIETEMRKGETKTVKNKKNKQDTGRQAWCRKGWSKIFIIRNFCCRANQQQRKIILMIVLTFSYVNYQ